MSQSPVVSTIADQLRALGLNLRRCGLVQWDQDTLKVNRHGRCSGVLITYNHGTDLYDIRQYRGCDVSPLADGCYAENLLDVISEALN